MTKRNVLQTPESVLARLDLNKQVHQIITSLEAKDLLLTGTCKY